MGVIKSITIAGVMFSFEEKANDWVLHVSLFSDACEAAHSIMTAEESKEAVEALDIVRGWVKPRENRPFTEQELKF
jgi:hypothetical protein